MAYIEITGVSKSYAKRKVLEDVSLSINRGEVLGLLGSSGSGKTTLLRAIAGLDDPDRGQITVDGIPYFDSVKGISLQPHKRGVGMVFQDLGLWPNLTVEEHISFVLEAKKKPKNDREGIVDRYLRLASLEHRRKAKPEHLSGGEKQRTALIRALAQKPKILLLDEPFSGIDEELREELKKEVLRLKKEFDATVIYVTHVKSDLAGFVSSTASIKDGRVHQS